MIECSNFSVYSDSFEYFFWVKHSDIIINKGGKTNIDVTGGSYCDNKIEVGSFHYYGEKSLTDFEKDVIDPLVDEYVYKSSVGQFSDEKLLDKAIMVTDMLGKEVTDPETGHRYMLVRLEGAVGWKVCKERCEDAGGHLVTITSQKEQDFVSKLCDPSYSMYAYIGGYRENEGGDWYWITGEPFEYKHLGDISKFNDYLTMDQDTHSWNAVNDVTKFVYFYICEWDE